MTFSSSSPYSIESSMPGATYNFSRELIRTLKNRTSASAFTEIVVLCIGTDRSTGDCLGPLVGDKLSKKYMLQRVNVLGTLNDPVHAKNIELNIKNIYKEFKAPIVIAVDASLGKSENIGKINLFSGPLYPGSGVNKNIMPVGDISITGIVNISGLMEYIVLQNTRLAVVMQMADIISLALYMSLRNFIINDYIIS